MKGEVEEEGSIAVTSSIGVVVERRLVRKVVLLTLAGLVFLAFSAAVVNAAIYVPDDYGTIQWAVDNATAGDTIIVRDGAYNENVDVGTRLTLKSENGTADCIVNASNPGGNAFWVYVNYVNISGFTVQNATASTIPGIYLWSVSHCNISGNNATNNDIGIYLYKSSNNKVTNNIADSNTYGIYIYDSSNNNTVANNTANSNNVYGIYIYDSSNNNTVANNTANLNNEAGIYMSNSNDNNITDNTASQTDLGYGIYMSNANNNKLTNNNASYNNGGSLSYGIYLTSSSDNTFFNNTANSNPCSGIWLNSSSNNNTFTNNTASSNNVTDFYSTSDSRNNTVEDLFISSYPTTVSFIYGNGVELKGVKTAPDDPSDKVNISKYVNATNVTADSWLFLNVNYNESDLGDVAEDSLRLWRHNGSWHEVAGGGVNEAENYVYANITEFSVFAPLGVAQGQPINCTCGDICVNTSGWWRNNGTFNASTTRIQDAIGNASAGNTVYVYNGSYSENVNVDKQLTLRGEGADVVTVTAKSTGDHVFDVTANLVNITGFNVTGATNYPMAGIYLNRRQHGNISNNNASNNNCGIYLDSSTNNSLSGNTAYNNSNRGIFLSSSSNNTLSDNTVYNNGGTGISVSSSSNFNTLTNNTAFNNSGDGIRLMYSSNFNTLTDNTAFNNSGDGIKLDSSCNNLLSNNIAYNNILNHGISLESSSINNTLTNNTAFNNSGDGIRLMYSSNFNTLTDNTAFNNSGDGIKLDSSCNNLLSNNIAYNNILNHGINLESSSINNTLTNNTVYNNSWHGIKLDSSCNFNTLTNNTAFNNTWDGIQLDYSSNNSLSFNYAYNNGWDGIYVRNSSNFNTLTQNTLYNNNWSGIRIDSASNFNTLMNNSLSFNDCGISLSSANNNSLTNNIAFNNTAYYGIYLESSSNNSLTNNIVYNNSWQGIRLDSSCNFNTLTNNTAFNNSGDGIKLSTSSNHNTLANNTASNNTDFDFYSDETSHNNTVEYLRLSSYPTTVSFTYDNGVGLKGVKNAPDDLTGKVNISKFVDATNVTADSWLFLNVSYNESDVPAEVDEASLRMWRHDGSDWTVVSGTNGVNTAENYVYANISKFSVFAPLGDAAGASAPNITSFAPESPVNDTYGIRRKFNVTVNQTVNVTWYLNGTAQTPKNESVTDAEYTLHAQYIGENNVTAVAENVNGMVKQEWIWNVTAATIAIEVNKTVRDPKTGNWEKAILANVSDELRFRILVHNNGTEVLTNITVNDTLSAGLEYVAGNATVNGGDCEPPGLVVWANSLVWYYDAGNSCTEPFKNLSCGQNITIEFNVTKKSGGKVLNCVNVSGWCNETEPDVQVFDEDCAVVRGQRDDTVIFRSGTWYVDTTCNHLWDDSFEFGTVPGDVPVVGDINRDGLDDTAIFRSGMWYVDTTGNHLWDVSFKFGTVAGDVPVVGDINRDGLDDTAIFRSGTWYVDTTGNHLWDDSFEFGLTPGDVPVVGDINRDGLDDTAIFRSGTWYVDTTGNHLWDDSFEFGLTPGDVPVVGDINRDGLDDTTIFRSGTWYVDTTGNHLWDDSFEFGLTPGDVPLVGDIYGFAIEVNKTVWDSKTEEWVDGIKADLNAEVRFKIWIFNNGTSSLTNISVNDTMSASLEYAAGNATVNDMPCEPEEISGLCLKWYYNASRTCTSPFLNIHSGENVTIEFNATKNRTSDDTNCVNVSAWYNETGSHVQVVDEDSAGVYGWWDDVAIFRSGTWYVDTEGNYIRGTGGWTESFKFGLSPGDVPLVGDINRDGRDDVAIFRSGTWYVDTTGDYQWDESFTFGLSPGDVPLVGDINRDGTDDVAIFRHGAWYVDTQGNYINHTGGWTKSFTFGPSPGDVPVVGDINRDGTDDIAIFRGGTWYVDTEGNYINHTGGWNEDFKFGASPGDVPVVGDINRDGLDDTAIFRSGTWYVDTEGNYINHTGGWTKSFTFGARPGDVPIVGDIK